MKQRADVIIIGAGIIGLSCAWRLAQAGLTVTVFERNAPGSEASQAALGLLGFHYAHGKPAAYNALRRASRQFYPSIIDELTEATGRKPDNHKCGQLVVALTQADVAHIKETFELNTSAGIPVERPTPAESQMLAPGINPDLIEALFFPDSIWVDNTALTLIIAQAAKGTGVEIVRGQVQSLEIENDQVTGVKAAGELWPAGWVVLAAGSWSGQISGVPTLPVEPVRGQALAVDGQPLRRIVESPRGYVVPKGDGQTMLGATVEWAGFEAVNTLEGLQQVMTTGLEIAPVLGHFEFLGAWAGLRPGTPDDLPFIGPFASLPNLVAATGHFRNGILLAPITAEIVRSIITGQPPVTDWEPFSPDRISTLG